MVINRNFWQNKKVFVTGHTGFKGSWLSLWLHSLGATVTGYSLSPSTSPALFDLTCIENNIQHIIADIRNAAQLAETIKQTKPEIIFHLAAQPLVRYSYEAPVETYETNVMGSLYLLEAIRATDSVRSCVMVTTDKCYENKEWHWGYRENEPMGGFDLYSSSKGCMELLIASYRNAYFSAETYASHGTAIATVRAGNVIGGGDWTKDRLIPDILTAFEKQQPVAIRNPYSIRPWQHVLEPLSGYLEIAERLYKEGSACAEPWNLGPEPQDAKTVEWVVSKLSQLWGKGANWYHDKETHHPHEAHYLKLDCSKARVRLNWKPCWSLEKALKEIVKWQHAYNSGSDMRTVTLEQISDYSSNLG